MHAGYRTDSYGALHEGGRKDLSRFLALPFEDEPGTYFFYDNGIPDVLAAIIWQKTGQRVSGYLRFRLFDPLRIQEVRVEQEGELDDLPTFCVTTPDLLKLTEFFYHRGCWRERQLLDPALAGQAVSFLVPAVSAVRQRRPHPGVWVPDMGESVRRIHSGWRMRPDGHRRAGVGADDGGQRQ